MGKLHLGISLWTIMAVIMAFGTDQLMVKEIARAPEKISDLFGTKVVLSSGLFLVCMVGLYFASLSLGYDPLTVYAIVLVGIEFWLWQFVSANESTLQGLERMEHISVGRIAGHTFNVLVGISLLLLGFGLFAIIAVRIVAALVVFAFQFVRLRQMTEIRPRFDLPLIPKLLGSGWPYFLTGISMVVYMQLDVVIMSFLVSEEAIGWYGTADQLFGTLLFIPTAFITAIYPVYSKLAVNDEEPLKALMSKSFDSMLLVGVPIGLGLFLIANPLVSLLYGAEFKNSGPVLAAFGIVLILTYLNMLVGQFLISIDKQRPWALVMAIATAATIPLDLWLIPWTNAVYANGALGGAIAFIFTELAMLLCGIALLPSQTLGLRNVFAALRIFTAGLAMVGVVWWFGTAIIPIQVAIGGVVYLGLILLLRVVPNEDLEYLKAMVQQTIAKFMRKEVAAVSQ